MPRNRLPDRLLRGEIVLLDGAMGTELERRGVATPLPLWSAQALLDAPDTIRAIHEEYVGAGAEVITACTFRTTPRALAKARMRDEADRLTALAISLAREARDRAGAGRDGGGAGREVWIAGSMAPLEDCYRPGLAPGERAAAAEHADQAGRLARSGAEVFLIETMNTIAEARAAIRGAKATGLPVLASFICQSEAEILGGEPLGEAARMAASEGADAVLVNCVPVEMAAGCLDTLARAIPATARGCYPNAGAPDLGAERWKFDLALTPERLAEAAQGWLSRGAQVVGGCCGTGPAHIAALRSALPPVLLE
jgi:S-methylmethionine-dependent homocysteine/selenocysteine methylase